MPSGPDEGQEPENAPAPSSRPEPGTEPPDADARPRRSARRPGPKPAGPLASATTRRAAVLAMVVAALALTIAVPLRTYLEQRSEAASLEDRQQELRRQVQELSDRKDQLADPAQVQAEARSRLRYVMPGETPYVVEVPDGGKGSTQPDNKPKSTEPWFQELWKSVTK